MDNNGFDVDSLPATKSSDTRVIQPTNAGEMKVAIPKNKRVLLTEDEVYEELPFGFTKWNKIRILVIIAFIQLAMNLNASLYSNAIEGISEQYHVSHGTARWGAAIFLITYAIGCELWAPWSEELGRWKVLQTSMFLMNLFQLPVALGPIASILVGRALGGLSLAGGSVTLAVIADMYEPGKQQYAVAFVSFASVAGGVVGPVMGGFLQTYCDWQWCIWVQLIFGSFVQFIHFFFVPETRTSIVLNNIAKKRRQNEPNPSLHKFGPSEDIKWKDRINVKEILHHNLRPFAMFVKEPIVLVLSLLSGFSDALIFMFIASFDIVYGDVRGFSHTQTGLMFIPLLFGYFISWGVSVLAIKRNIAQRSAQPTNPRAQYESRLWILLFTAPCLTIGLFIFAGTTSGPQIHWIGSAIACILIGIANYSIYMATIDYMIAAYGVYSASATGGNGFARDMLAGALTMPAGPFFTNIGGVDNPRSIMYAALILAGISLPLVAFVYVVYWKGETMRKKSPFAMNIIDARDNAKLADNAAESALENNLTELATLKRRPTIQRLGTAARLEQAKRLEITLGPTPSASRRASFEAMRNPFSLATASGNGAGVQRDVQPKLTV